MRSKMKNIDPIKIKIDKEMYHFFKQEATIFEAYKNDQEKFVINHILSRLLVGFYEQYSEKISGQYKSMKKILTTFIDDPVGLDSAIKQLIEDRAQEETPKLDDGNTKEISIRPTADTDEIISEINKSMQETNETQAGYYRRMFYSYSRLPMFERERILHCETVKKLEEACKKHREVALSFWSNNKREDHRVLPYSLIHGLDERYNYLLCQEYNEKEKRPMTRSFRLCRIKVKATYRTDEQFDNTVLKHFEKMIKLSPQHSINEDTETVIEMTESGRASFRSIYNNRPIQDRIEGPDSNGIYTYYFSCSQKQLFLYFRRFNPGEARIIKPESLKQELREFHTRQLEDLKG